MSGSINHQPITAYDESGRLLLISRQQWVDEVLPTTLTDAWCQPDLLRSHVLVALEDGFADQLLPAGQRLQSIDPCRERGAAALALVQLENGRFDLAKETLRQCLDPAE